MLTLVAFVLAVDLAYETFLEIGQGLEATEPLRSVGCPRSRKARSETRVEKDMEVVIDSHRGSVLRMESWIDQTGVRSAM